PGALAFSTWIDRQQDARTEIAGSDRLDLVGQLSGRDGFAFLASARILREGGTQETFPERIYVEGANAATIVVAVGTSFTPGKSDPRNESESRGDAPRPRLRDAVNRDLDAACAKSYATLKEAHSAVHRQLY